MKSTYPYRAFWLLAGPMIVSNVSVSLLGLVDTAVIGHLDKAVYLGGVAVGSVIFDFLYWGMGFLRMGTTGIAAQAHGKAEADEIRTILAQSCLISLGIALFILILRSYIINFGLMLLGSTGDIKYYAGVYCRWLIWNAPALMILFSVNGWLLGMQNAMAALGLGISINIINIILDIVLVVILDMDVRGVALATVISHYLGIVITFFLIRKQLKKHPGKWSLRRIFHYEKLKAFLVLNHNIFIRTISLMLVFAFFTREGAKQSDLILVSNSILMKFYMVMALALDGLNHAAEALIGKAIGMRSKILFNHAVSLALRWSIILGIGFMLFYCFFGNSLIRLLTNIELVRETAKNYLPWMVILPVLSIWCFLLDGVFIGATRGKEMRNTMLICTFFFFFPVWYVFRFLGNHGLWLAFSVFTVVRGITLGIYYYRIERRKEFVVGEG